MTTEDLEDSTASLALSSASDIEGQRNHVVGTAEAFVKAAFADHDPSHDYHHVHRVRLLALSLTNSPEVLGEVDTLVVELGALFHDLVDSKYSSSDLSSSSVLAPFFASINTPTSLLTPAQISTIEKIVSNVSWSKDVRRREARARAERQKEELSIADKELDAWLSECKEFWCVSDADRLDSIGSIGIMRCAAFSCVKKRPLYIPPNNPTMDPRPPAEQAEGYNGSAVAHFYEKLLKIRGEVLFTSQARSEAERRQAMMESFLQELDLEWMVASQGAEIARLQWTQTLH